MPDGIHCKFSTTSSFFPQCGQGACACTFVSVETLTFLGGSGSDLGSGSGSRVLLIGSAFGGGGVSSSDDEDEDDEPFDFRLSSFAGGTGLIPLFAGGALATGWGLAGDTIFGCAWALTGMSSSELDESELDDTFFTGFAVLLLDLAILESLEE